MNKALMQDIKYWLREASDMGRRGFYYDADVISEEISEDWQEFEKEAIETIDHQMSNYGII